VTTSRATLFATLCVALVALAAPPLSASAHSPSLRAAAPALPFGSASAVIGGAPWPGRGIARISYYNASSAKWPVAQAVKAWNSSGARVRFVAVPRRRAQVVITNSTTTPPSDYSMSGYASVGYIYPGGGYVTLSRLAHPGRPHYGMAGVAAHELGHVLGLAHEDRRCATMNSSSWAACSDARPCRLLERDDIRGAIELYGGRAKMVRPAFCPKPPSQIRATGDVNAYGVTLEWRNPSGPFFSRVQVARAKGRCPQRPRAGIGWQAPSPAGASARLVDRDYVSGERLLTGRYCYGFWSVGNPGPASSRRTIWVDFDPSRPAAPANLRAALGEAGAVSLTWAITRHPELEGVEGAGARGRCPAESSDGEYFFGDAGRSSSVQLQTPGRYCFVAWARDSIGALSAPTDPVWLDYRGSAPDADFSYYADGLTAYFYDQSFDPDGDEIASRRWEFGDGVVTDGNDPAPSHAYAAAGTYTVRLTVTDSAGLSGTTTVSATITPPSEPEPVFQE
jgi:chitodextrinase